MKRRSVTSFVLGLISGLLVLAGAWIFTFLFALVVGLNDKVPATLEALFNINVYLVYIGAILSIIGASLCFNKARAGGIILLVAFIFLAFYPLVIALILASTGSFGSSILSFGIICIPALFTFVAGLLGIFAKSRPKLIQQEDMKIGL